MIKERIPLMTRIIRIVDAPRRGDGGRWQVHLVGLSCLQSKVSVHLMAGKFDTGKFSREGRWNRYAATIVRAFKSSYGPAYLL